MIDIRVFAGQQPAIAPRLLERPHATKAVNCRLDNGDLRALAGPLAVSEQPVLATNTQALFLYYGASWFSFSEPVDIARSPIKQDQYDRVYFTGLDVPRYTSNEIATGSGVRMPVTTRKLGVPNPGVSPPVDYNAPADNTDPLDDNTRFYKTTFVTDVGEESGPSPASNKVVVQDPNADSVTITLPTLANNDRGITKVKIYRSATGGTDSGYFLVGTEDYGTSSFTDTPTTPLGPTLATEGFALPPTDMHGIISMKGGMLIGASGQTLCPSEAYLPYAYKKSNQLVTNAPIVAMAPLPNGAIVATEGYPELLSGTSPDSLYLDRFELAQACVSARSMVDMGTMAIYAAPDGLVAASVQGAKLITEGMIHRDAWQALAPESIHAYHFENQYIAFYDTGSEKGGFIFDPARKDITFLDFYADTGYRDLASDNLYLLIDDELCAYRKGGALEYTWRSKIFDTPPVSLPLFRVKHKPGEDITQTTVIIHTEDGPLHADTLTIQDWGFVPPGLFSYWQIEVQSKAAIEAVMLGDTMQELGV